jgi:hypothetical protein
MLLFYHREKLNNMKNNNFKENFYCWSKDDSSVVIKKRILNRFFAIFAVIFTTPLMFMIIYFLYSGEITFKSNLDFYMNSLMILLFLGIPIISIISLFWVPTKIIFNIKNIKYYPFSLLPFITILIDYHDVKNVGFTKKNVASGLAGIGFVDTESFLFLEIKNKSLNLIKIKSKIIPESYDQLKNEILLHIEKANQ